MNIDYLFEEYDDSSFFLSEKFAVTESTSEMPKDGEIWLVFFPYKNTEKIEIDHQNRPALFIMDKKFGLIALQLSSVNGKPEKTIKRRYNHTLVDWQAAGLDKESFVIGSTVRMIKDIKLLRYIGKMSESDFNNAKEKFELFKKERETSLFNLNKWMKFRSFQYTDNVEMRTPQEIMRDETCDSIDTVTLVRFVCDKYKIEHKVIGTSLENGIYFWSIFNNDNGWYEFRFRNGDGDVLKYNEENKYVVGNDYILTDKDLNYWDNVKNKFDLISYVKIVSFKSIEVLAEFCSTLDDIDEFEDDKWAFPLDIFIKHKGTCGDTAFLMYLYCKYHNIEATLAYVELKFNGDSNGHIICLYHQNGIYHIAQSDPKGPLNYHGDTSREETVKNFAKIYLPGMQKYFEEKGKISFAWYIAIFTENQMNEIMEKYKNKDVYNKQALLSKFKNESHIENVCFESMGVMMRSMNNIERRILMGAVKEELYQTERKHIIPLDLTYKIPNRILCMNTHLINIATTHCQYIDDKLKGKSFIESVLELPGILKTVGKFIYSLRDQFEAVDFMASGAFNITDHLKGCPILVCNDGEVCAVVREHGKIEAAKGYTMPENMKNNVDAFGNGVIVKHREGAYYSAYCHLDKVMVKAGDYIQRGTQIGTVGNTGNSIMPHLHFELFYDTGDAKERLYFDNLRYTEYENPVSYLELMSVPKDDYLKTLNGCCYVTDLPAIKNFDDFCESIDTPFTVNAWYIKNEVQWPEYEEGSTGPFIWPDELIKTKSGICYDHALFMYFYCKRRKIPVALIGISKMVLFEDIKQVHQTGHIVAAFKSENIPSVENGWYVFDPQPERQVFGNSIRGPFESPEKIAEMYKETWKKLSDFKNSRYELMVRTYIHNEKNLVEFDKAYGKPIKNRDKWTLEHCKETNSYHMFEDIFKDKGCDMKNYEIKNISYDEILLKKIRGIPSFIAGFTMDFYYRKWVPFFNNPNFLWESTEPSFDDIEFISEAAGKTYNAKNFEEFCKECDTPGDAMNWFIHNKVEWTKDNDDVLRWPDILIKDKKGLCYEQTIFMHFFFQRKKIEHRIAFFSITFEDGNGTGHAWPLFKEKNYVYGWLYLMPGKGMITGPYKSWNEGAENMVQFFQVMLLSGSEFTHPIKKINWSIQDYKETEKIDKYLNKPILQRDLIENPDLYGSMHYFNNDFFIFKIHNIAYYALKFLKWRKELLLNENLSIVEEATEPPSETTEKKTMGICDYVLNMLPDIDINEFNKIKSGKRFMYTKATIMKKDIPLVILLSYCEGLSTVLRKAGIKFQFSDKRPGLTGFDALENGVLKFADGYLIYNKFPLENSLLMNGFSVINTKQFTYDEMDQRETYINIFDILYGMRMLGNALDNFYDWLIDPVTRVVLEDLNYPTDFVGLLLVGNALLADNSYTNEISMDNYRVRNNEMVYAYAYKRIADSYGAFRRTSGNKNPEKITISQSGVITDIMQSQVVEDVSELSPIVEVEKTHILTDKGPSGTNLAQAYTVQRRCYDKSMVGVVAIAQAADANVGVTKTLTLNPNIVNTRGYVDQDKHMNEANIFGMAEMLTNGCINHDDPIRGSMSVKQSKHIMPTLNSTPNPISNGAEKVMPYHLSDDFCVVAKEDGKVISNNPATGVIVIEYKSKKRQVINSNVKVVKNGAGGFYLTNRLNCDLLKPGKTFKKNEVLAYNDLFFSRSKYEGVRFNIGTLCKVACISSSANFEDGNMITDKLSKKLGADVCMELQAIVGKNSNVDYIVKLGQYVNVGDPLITYDNSSDDDMYNKMLANIGKDLKEDITSMGKTPVKAKYTGVIQDIKIYTTVEPSKMSPSLRKIVEDYFATIKKQENDIKKYAGGEDVNLAFTDSTEIVDGGENGKIMGIKVGEGVLFRFFIRYRDNLDIGDKLVHFTAMKYVNGEMIPKGLEPYSLGRPEEEISTNFAPGGVLGRMTPSIFNTIYCLKILVELKRAWLKMYQKDNPSWKPKDELY